MLSRRELVVAGTAAVAAPRTDRNDPRSRFIAGVRQLEIRLGQGARICVKLVDPARALHVAYRSTERLPMCSTFKLPLVGMVLFRTDRKLEQLNREVPIPNSPLLPNSPTTTRFIGRTLSIGALCEAAMTLSDNSAANLLLETLAGPAALTTFLRSIGDAVTRLDRIETALNEATPNDPRDTTTPAAMLDDLRNLTTGRVLGRASRNQLLFWLAKNTTGKEKLNKGLPGTWSIADKTGTGGHGTNNDVALIWPEGRDLLRPILVAAYISGGAEEVDAASRNIVHRRIGELIVELVGQF